MNENPKRILIFSNSYYPKHVGGAEVAIKEITDRITKDEIVFHMVTNRFDASLPKVEQVGNVLVHRIGFAIRGADTARTHHPLFYLQKILFVPQAAMKAYTLNKQHAYDGFWAMMAYMSLPITLLRLFSVKKPYVLTLQEGDPEAHVFGRWYIRPFMPLLALGFKNAAVIQTISNFLSVWPKQFGYSGTVLVVPNGVELERFANVAEEDIVKTKHELGKQEGETWLIHTGRYVTKNGLDSVVSALADLPKSVKLLLVGEGPLQEELRTQALRFGVRDRVVFKKFVDATELPRYLKACDIFIRPSRSEGQGISFIEAMAAGIPVVATQVGGIADFLSDRERNLGRPATGFAVDPDAPEQIALKVAHILNTRDEVRDTVLHAKEMVKTHYSWDLIARDMQEKVFSHVGG